MRHLEISWCNALDYDGVILITKHDPIDLKQFKQTLATEDDHQYYVPLVTETQCEIVNGTTTKKCTEIVVPQDTNAESSGETEQHQHLRSQTIWTYDDEPVVYWLQPHEPNGWKTTNVPFKFDHSKNITIHTRCYGYWATYLAMNGTVALAKTCISAHPTWMNDMRAHIGSFKFHELFVVGTHDSGSYRLNFDPKRNETLVSKYSITQDDDVRSQLMHGIRYLDIRIGHYRATQPPFWVNHGISRQQPLNEILTQVRDFVLETNELVIFDIQEFPVGNLFGPIFIPTVCIEIFSLFFFRIW